MTLEEAKKNITIVIRHIIAITVSFAYIVTYLMIMVNIISVAFLLMLLVELIPL